MSELESKIYELLGISHPSDKTGFYMMCRAMQAHIRGEIEQRDKLLDIAKEEHESRPAENKIKAEGVREVIDASLSQLGWKDSTHYLVVKFIRKMQDNANKLEKGDE